MSAGNKPLVTAADQKIAPQYYNPTSDQYEHVQGKNGGNNVNVIESALPAGAATAAKQDQQTAQLEAIAAKDFATDAKLDLILSKLGDIESEIEAIKSTDGIKRIDDTVAVELTGSKVEILKPFDKLEIRDASSKNTTVDLTNMRILAVVAMSTLDKPVYLGQRSLAIESTPASIGYWNGTGKWVGGFPPTGSTPPTPNDGYAVIQPNEKVLLTTFWPHLLGLQAIPYGFFARCYEAPTSGSLSVWVWGGPIV